MSGRKETKGRLSWAGPLANRVFNERFPIVVNSLNTQTNIFLCICSIGLFFNFKRGLTSITFEANFPTRVVYPIIHIQWASQLGMRLLARLPCPVNDLIAASLFSTFIPFEAGHGGVDIDFRMNALARNYVLLRVFLGQFG